jgi:hypothetical protein
MLRADLYQYFFHLCATSTAVPSSYYSSMKRDTERQGYAVQQHAAI